MAELKPYGKWSKGKVIVVDDEDYALLSTYRWHVYPDHNSGKFYAWCHVKRKMTPIAALILPKETGKIVDHRDGDPLNNKRSNLRYATRGQNSRNVPVPKNNTTGFKGVHWLGGNRWQARIGHNGRLIHIGVFRSRHKAASAYNRMAIALFGEFARINENSFQ